MNTAFCGIGISKSSGDGSNVPVLSNCAILLSCPANEPEAGVVEVNEIPKRD